MRAEEQKIIRIRTSPEELRKLADDMKNQIKHSKIGDSSLVDVLVASTELHIEFHHTKIGV
jgi:hypothetical protein